MNNERQTIESRQQQKERLSQEIEQLKKSTPVTVTIEEDNDSVMQEILELEKEKASVEINTNIGIPEGEFFERGAETKRVAIEQTEGLRTINPVSQTPTSRP